MPTYVQVSPSKPVPKIERNAPYKALMVLDLRTDEEWQAELSRELARSGCLYMMAWGTNCSSWDDSVDLANLEAHDFGEIPEDSFIMTTWHEEEELAETFEFAKHSAHHPSVELEDLLIIHVGESDRKTELVDDYIRS